MAQDVIMPALGMAQETGVLLQWLKSEGDQVTKGEPLMEIETDKATVEVEASASGILAKITANPGDEIPVGQVIAVILAPGEAVPPGEQVSKTAALTSSAQADQIAGGVDTPAEIAASPLAARIAAEHNIDLRQVKTSGGRIQKEDVLAYLEAQQAAKPANGRNLASPKARRLAREQNLDLTAIHGSGPDGAVLAADVLATAEARAAEPIPEVSLPAAPAPAAVPAALPVSRMWRVMAQRLSESWQTIPHFYLAVDANAGRLVRWREDAQPRLAEKITFTDLLIKLVAAALRKHPRLNAKWGNETIQANNDINIGLAVAVEEGLIVPVLHQADRFGLNDIAARRLDLVSKAQAGTLSLAELSEGTFTLSNLGMYGIDAFNAIVNPPQAAILALGRIADRVVPVNGQPAVQPVITMTLSCDHRIVDGARAAQFMQTLVRYIEDPLSILD